MFILKNLYILFSLSEIGDFITNLFIDFFYSIVKVIVVIIVRFISAVYGTIYFVVNLDIFHDAMGKYLGNILTIVYLFIILRITLLIFTEIFQTEVKLNLGKVFTRFLVVMLLIVNIHNIFTQANQGLSAFIDVIPAILVEDTDEGGTNTCNSSSSFTDLGAGITDKESGFIAAGNTFASVIVKAMVVCNNPDTVCEPECFTTLKDFEEFNINEKDKDGKRLYDFNWIPMVAMLMLFPLFYCRLLFNLLLVSLNYYFGSYLDLLIATYVNEKAICSKICNDSIKSICCNFCSIVYVIFLCYCNKGDCC